MTAKRRILKILPVLLAALVLVGASGLPSHSWGWHGASWADDGEPVPPAQQAPDTLGNGQKGCRQYQDAAGGTLIGYIVPCIAHTIADTTAQLCGKMVELIMPIVLAFIVLVVTFFGIKIMSGEGQVYSEGFLLLIKIGLVLGILGTLPSFIPVVYDCMTEAVNVVSTAITKGDPGFWQQDDQGGDGSQNTCGTDGDQPCHCDVSKYGDANTLPLWKGLDCVLGKLYGLTMGTSGGGAGGQGHPSMLLAASAVGVMGGFFFGGTFGVILFVAILGVLWTLLTIVLRTAFAFINSYLYASVLLLIAPLFVPLMLLRVTGNYFDTWWRSMFACFLLPIIVTAYAMMAIDLYDRILFAPDAEINKLFNMEGNKDLQNLMAAEQPSKRPCDMQIGGNPILRTLVNGLDPKQVYSSPFMQHKANPGTSAYSNICSSLSTPVIVARKIDPKKNYATDKQAFEDMIKDCIKIFLVSWLVAAGFRTVQGFAAQIVGSSAVVTSYTKPSALEARLETGMAYAKQGLGAAFADDKTGKSASGAEFIRRIPGALGAALGTDKNYPGFLGGISADPNE